MPSHRCIYLGTAGVVAAHAEAMKRSGHQPTALCFPDKLKAALERPKNAAHYADADLIVQAATLIIAISEAQAFEQGNKRTAHVAGTTFLRLNDFKYIDDPDYLAVMIEEAASPVDQEAAIRDLAEWLRPRVRPLHSST